MAADASLYLKNLWYLAFHGSFLKKGKLTGKEILGEKIVFGRDAQGKPFALRDNCPHRGVPLSHGWFKDDCIQCCYHGWTFNTEGTCTGIPAMPPDATFDPSKIKVFQYPIAEINDTIWIYISDKKLLNTVPKEPAPNLVLTSNQKFKHVESVIMPADIDHSVIGLIDPAHVTFVHQSWYWRSAKKLKLKEKKFEPTTKGFKMVRHAPSANSKGYGILKGGTSTEITFEIPGIRTEHILVGEKNQIVSITVLTPLNERQTELTHIFYTDIALANFLWLPLKYLGKQFIGQDLGVFNKLNEGLESKPTLSLIGEPDLQARWYYEIKRLWALSQQNNEPLVNPVKAQTLHWVT
jgi:phenylpropionate dioxygenase-like ring-hydroxylating dioxygenase large terminal subunit